MAISPSVEYLERAWDDAKYGRVSEHPYIEAVFPSVFEPEVAPPGKHVALCFTQFGPFELREGTWETEREAYGRKIVRTLAEYSPNLESSVENMEVLAPPDIEQRFGLLVLTLLKVERRQCGCIPCRVQVLYSLLLLTHLVRSL